MKSIYMLGLITLVTSISAYVFAEETKVEAAEVATIKGTNKVKKAFRKAEDKICESFNGKVQCVVKKIKHTAQNLSDDASVTGREAKNKFN